MVVEGLVGAGEEEEGQAPLEIVLFLLSCLYPSTGSFLLSLSSLLFFLLLWRAWEAGDQGAPIRRHGTV